MAEDLTPTYRRTAAAFSKIVSLHSGKEGMPLSFEDLQGIVENIASVTDENGADGARESMLRGLSYLKYAAEEQPSVAEAIAFGVEAILLAVTSAKLSESMRKSSIEASRMSPLIAQNRAKEELVAIAQEVASEHWRCDVKNEIRIGVMAEKVYRALVADGYSELLPGTADRIKEWIKPVAPEYARKGGRRKKG